MEARIGMKERETPLIPIPLIPLLEPEEYFARFYEAVIAPIVTHAGFDPAALRQLDVDWDSIQALQERTD